MSALSASSADVAVATAYDAACAMSVVTTADGGATWEKLDATGTLTQVSLGRPDGRWALSRGQVVRETGSRFAATPAKPCVGTDVAPPSLVAAVSTAEAYVVCQAANGTGRLVTRTRDGGRTWLRLAGKLPQSGLDGKGRIAALHVGDAARAAVLLHGARCPTGEIRVTANAGFRWTAVPCVTLAGVPVQKVLDVVIGTDGGLLAAVSTPEVRVLVSPDGKTWSTL